MHRLLPALQDKISSPSKLRLHSLLPCGTQQMSRLQSCPRSRPCRRRRICPPQRPVGVLLHGLRPLWPGLVPSRSEAELHRGKDCSLPYRDAASPRSLLRVLLQRVHAPPTPQCLKHRLPCRSDCFQSLISSEWPQAAVQLVQGAAGKPCRWRLLQPRAQHWCPQAAVQHTKHQMQSCAGTRVTSCLAGGHPPSPRA